jgi:hypothetical protein
MADTQLMDSWPAQPDDEGCYEMIIPQHSIYMLTRASGDRVVNATGPDGENVRHENVQWFLDFSLMIDGEISSARFLTTETLSDDQAKDWAQEQAAKYEAEIKLLSSADTEV